MGKVTTGNRLYFYRLLSEKIGVGTREYELVTLK